LPEGERPVLETADEVKQQWDRIKRQERERR
jgi:hypothetical protein